MLACHVQDLLALLRRQTAPDIPRRQRNADGTESPGESRPHRTILAQALAFAPFVVALPVVFALVVAVVSIALGLLGLFRRRRRCDDGLLLLGLLALVLVSLVAVLLALALALAAVVDRGRGSRGGRSNGSRRCVAG